MRFLSALCLLYGPSNVGRMEWSRERITEYALNQPWHKQEHDGRESSGAFVQVLASARGIECDQITDLINTVSSYSHQLCSR